MPSFSFLSALSCALLTIPGAFASAAWIRAEQDHWATSSSLARRDSSNTTIEELYVELPIDHNDTSATVNGSSTFWNRYWVVDEFYEEGGPVFIYDVGELDGSTKFETFLTNDSIYFRQLMRNYSGIGIVWEHRYCTSHYFWLLEGFAVEQQYSVLAANLVVRWQLYACDHRSEHHDRRLQVPEHGTIAR